MSRTPLWPAPAYEPRRAQLARIARGLARVDAEAEKCNEVLAALARRRAELVDQRARLGRKGDR